ncbi:ABC-type transport auxiliary lipoprotein family protein [Sabulicella glaciei]|uniref:ABC-type transport auxiliary lipoprotein family protein n=1 Tax=Sabulicella glaciei TaxID=2984948 RepID=A0ABT3P174_9PROT|nr:ABC-type transport auxiliary lipoprotein family protein [Roseococcus sp. MDT2-1-1]MCW8088151.1 ABC-type transport auxiliary lipoprotein family protein [Roseococcus sp. MDT2-1-1]
MNRRHLPLLLLLSGCSVLPSRPYIETRRYALDPQREGRPRRSQGQALLLRSVSAGPGLDSRGLRRLRPDHSLEVAPYDEWVGPPAELAESALRDWLRESGLFPAVAAPGTRLAAPLVLEAELTRLERFGTVARAGMGALLLRNSANPISAPQVLAQTVVEAEVPVSGTEPSDEATAMRAALGQSFARLEQWLATNIPRGNAAASRRR